LAPWPTGALDTHIHGLDAAAMPASDTRGYGARGWRGRGRGSSSNHNLTWNAGLLQEAEKKKEKEKEEENLLKKSEELRARLRASNLCKPNSTGCDNSGGGGSSSNNSSSSDRVNLAGSVAGALAKSAAIKRSARFQASTTGSVSGVAGADGALGPSLGTGSSADVQQLEGSTASRVQAPAPASAATAAAATVPVEQKLVASATTTKQNNVIRLTSNQNLMGNEFKIEGPISARESELLACEEHDLSQLESGTSRGSLHAACTRKVSLRQQQTSQQKSVLARALGDFPNEPPRKQPRLSSGESDTWEAEYQRLLKWFEEHLLRFVPEMKLGQRSMRLSAEDAEREAERLSAYWMAESKSTAAL